MLTKMEYKKTLSKIRELWDEPDSLEFETLIQKVLEYEDKFCFFDQPNLKKLYKKCVQQRED